VVWVGEMNLDIVEVDWVAYPDVGIPGSLLAHDLSPRRQIGAVGELRQHFRLSLHHFEASRYYIIEAVLFSYNHFLQPFLRRKSSRKFPLVDFKVKWERSKFRNSCAARTVRWIVSAFDIESENNIVTDKIRNKEKNLTVSILKFLFVCVYQQLSLCQGFRFVKWPTWSFDFNFAV